ncbi:hypothetical protein MOO45_06635 [Bombilactobacillus folatiphilus]|uniref:Alpha/beta hydrolase n=1 Tax=Bombilactobacillus folatiphilus TaxID=2923362 RepID=A0ABY4P8E1_9LACO|nr:hypothetical protein [Bombilactobacillus folatiphilus]UQS81866.1 hypothetical protein MOO45_06635 [Bombilactobacillus folatiphilus]
MIEVKALPLSNGRINYLAEDLKLAQTTIFLPDFTQSVNSCVQVLAFNGYTNSYALDWRYHGLSESVGPLSVISFAQDLQEFVAAKKLQNYQIVAAGLSIFVAAKAVTQGLEPTKIIALDPRWQPDALYRQSPIFNDFEEMVTAGQQQAAREFEFDDYQKQMFLNAFVADYHLTVLGYQLYISDAQQKKFIQSLNPLSFGRQAPQLTLLMTQKTQEKIQKYPLSKLERQNYAQFTKSYVLKNTLDNLLCVTPLTVLNFIQ